MSATSARPTRSGATGCAVVVAASLMAGCVTTPGDKVVTVSQPKTPVGKTITSFTQAKRCMDQLFVEAGKSGIPITTGNISDETGTVKVSEQDMVINAIADMSVQSRAFTFFTVETGPSSVVFIQDQFAPLSNVRADQLPSVYIRGSISQSDNNVTSDGQSGSVTLPFVSIGKGETQVAGTVSIDLQMANVATRNVMSSVTTSNTITIVSNDDSTSARGLINQGAIGGALSISLSSAQREGRSQAVRTLMEYSLIELLGKYTRVPYQRCLSLDSTDPASMQTARALYDGMKPEERIRAVQAALVSINAYAGPINGAMSPRFQDAVSLAKARRDLVADGRVDFQLFNALYEENLISRDGGAVPGPIPGTQEVRVPTPTPASGRDPLGLTVKLTNPAPAVGEAISLRVATGQPARVYCYYEYVENGATVTTRIFPNRFQSENMVRPNSPIVVPGPSDPFKIRLNSTNDESIACVATTVEYGGARRLELLRQADLEPLVCPYPGVACPVFEHQKVDQFNTSAKKVTFRAAL